LSRDPRACRPHFFQKGLDTKSNADVLSIINSEKRYAVERTSRERDALLPAALMFCAVLLFSFGLWASSDALAGAVDLSAYTDMRSTGHMMISAPIAPAGRITGSQSGSVLMGRGDRVFLEMSNNIPCPAGKTFTICRMGSEVKRPDAGDALGRVVDYLGILEMEAQTSEKVCSAIVKESFRPIEGGDFLIEPQEPRPLCLEPITTEEKITVSIAAAKDSAQVMGQFSVVYLAGGEAHGLRRGLLMEILEGSPLNPLGYLIVTEVLRDSSIAVVILSQKEFHPFALGRTVEANVLDAVLKKTSLCREGR
jgi:hypothetical protein